MLVGAHVSVAKGYADALAYALSVRCECAQVFAKSPRQWRNPAPDPVAGALFAAERERAGFGPLFTHAAYLINLASPDDDLWDIVVGRSDDYAPQLSRIVARLRAAWAVSTARRRKG